MYTTTVCSAPEPIGRWRINGHQPNRSRHQASSLRIVSTAVSRSAWERAPLRAVGVGPAPGLATVILFPIAHPEFSQDRPNLQPDVLLVPQHHIAPVLNRISLAPGIGLAADTSLNAATDTTSTPTTHVAIRPIFRVPISGLLLTHSAERR